MLREIVVLIACLSMVGCAVIQETTPESSTKLLRSSSNTINTGAIVATVEQQGLNLTVSAIHTCDVRNDSVQLRTTKVGYTNQTPNYDWAALAAGVVLIGAGVGLVVDANNVYPDDKSSRTYNSVGPDVAKGVGFGAVGAGVVALAVPVVDFLRASGKKVTTEQITAAGDVVQPNVPCPNPAVSGGVVEVRVWEVRSKIGVLDNSGRFQANLDEVVDPDFVIGNATFADVLVNAKVVGAVQTKALSQKREARAWPRAPREQCRNGSTSACSQITKFVEEYPRGMYLEEALATIRAGREKADKDAEEQIWIEANATACAKGKAETPEAVDKLCKGVEKYVAQVPVGTHSKEANSILEAARKRKVELQKKIEKAEKDAAEKEAKAERQKCESECRMFCSHSRFSRNPGGCLSGCIGSRCTQ